MSLEKTINDLIIKSQSESFSKDEAYQFLDKARILIMEEQDKLRKKPELKPDPGMKSNPAPVSQRDKYPDNYREYDWRFHYSSGTTFKL